MGTDRSPSHIVVVGCGRVGSSLARWLTSAGHSVAVIDRREEAFDRFLGDLHRDADAPFGRTA
jgi:trk system potassium uptake protein TrkA